MKFILTALVLFLTLPVNAQWQIEQSVKIGTAQGDENMYDVKVLENGNFLSVGYTSSYADVVDNNFGLKDFWVIEFDKNGQIILGGNYGSPGNDIAKAFDIDQNYVYVVGTIDTSNVELNESTPNQIESFYDGIDIWVIKIDFQGNLIAQKTLGGSADENVNDIKVLSNGNIIIVGETESSDFDIAQNNGQKDVWIVELDNNLNLVREQTFGGSKNDGATALQIGSSNQLIIAGYATSDDGDIENNIGGRDAWIFSLDENWDINWQTNWGGTNGEGANDLITLNNGNLAICAETSSNTIENFNGLYDYAIAVFSSTGNLVWEHCYGGTNADSPYQIIENNKGNLMVLGYTFSVNGDINSFYSASDVWLIEVNANNGSLLKRKTFGGNKFEEGSCFTQYENDKYVLLSNTDSTDGDLEGKTPDGNHDLWLAFINDVSTDVHQINQNNISLQSNVVSNNIIIYNNNQAFEAFMYNLKGQIIKKITVKYGMNLVDISNFSEGQYLIVNAQNHSYSKFYKQAN